MNLCTGNIRKIYVAYLVPTLIAMLSNSLYCLVDVFFISKGAGSTGLAALNIAMPIFTLQSSIGLLFGVGGATIMSIAEGAKDTKLRNRAFTCSVVFMLIIGIVLSLLSFVFVEEFARMLGASEELLPHVVLYLKPIGITSFAFVLMYASSILMRSDHAPKLAMNALMIGNISNMVLDYVFVMIFDGGIAGASIATAFSPILTLLWISRHFLLKKNTVYFVKDFFQIDMFKRMLSAGLGSGIMEISAGAVIVIFNAIIISIAGAQALAAYSIITNIAYVLKGLLNGFAQAGQPIISANHGANQPERVKEVLYEMLKLSVIFTAVVYLIFLIFPEAVASVFTNSDQELLNLSAHGIRLYFSSIVFTAMNTALMYYFQSLERGKLATIISICKGFVFIIFGLSVLTPILQLDGVWLTMTFAEVLSLFICIYCYKMQDNTQIHM